MAPGTGAASNESISNIAGRILDREIELQRLITELHKEAADPSVGKLRRNWFYGLGNALPTESGLISATALFFSHCNDQVLLKPTYRIENGVVVTDQANERVSNHVPVGQVGATLYPQIAGQVINAGGSLFELGVDYTHSRELKRLGFNRKAVIARVLKLENEITTLLDTYASRATIYGEENWMQLEIRLLKQVNYQALHEFNRLERDATKMAVENIVTDSISLTRNVVGTVGNSINVAGVLRVNKRENGNGTIMNLVAASLITTRPVLINLSGFAATIYSDMRMRHYFAKNLLKEDAQSEYHSLLERFITKTSNGAISDQAFRSRLFAYKELEQKLDADADLKEFERRKAKQTAIRRYRETIYGPTKMAQSIIGLVVNFRRGSNSTSDNRLTADANLTYTSGQGLDITELTRERFADESELKRLQAAGMLPQQRLDDGLLKLEAAQTQLRM